MLEKNEKENAKDILEGKEKKEDFVFISKNLLPPVETKDGERIGISFTIEKILGEKDDMAKVKITSYSVNVYKSVETAREN